MSAQLGPWELADALYPPEGTVCALSVPGLDLVCDQEIMIDRPSQLPGHLVAASRGRRLYLHAMHDVVDWLAFAVWDVELQGFRVTPAPQAGAHGRPANPP